MISIEELRRIARLKGLKNIGYAEKDYLIDVILLSVSKNTKDELVFKGGTCLHKFYKLDRFSGDIDFTLRKQLDIDSLVKKIISDLTLFGIKAELKNLKTVFNSVLMTIRAHGPLYRGTSQSSSSIGFDINLKSGINLEPLFAKYTSLYPDVPSFSLLIMQEKEILAEKVRAILTRTKARDVYDLWFLLDKGVDFDTELVKKKLEYYGQRWEPKSFRNHLNLKKNVWETELKPLVQTLPKFRDVRSMILRRTGAWTASRQRKE